MERYKCFSDYRHAKFKKAWEEDKKEKVRSLNIDVFFSLKESVVFPDRYLLMLKNILTNLYKELEGTYYNNEKICDLLNSKFKVFKIYFIMTKDSSKSECIHKGNTKADMFNSIEVIFNSKLQERFYKNFKLFINEITMCLEHEFIHRDQWIKIKYEKFESIGYDEDDDRKYYSNKHEIMAYAWTLIETLRRQGFENNKILQILKMDLLTNDIYLEYKKLFGLNSPQMKLLRKYMYLYLTT